MEYSNVISANIYFLLAIDVDGIQRREFNENIIVLCL